MGKRQRFPPKQQQQQRSRSDGARRAHSDKSANAVPIQTQAIRVPPVKTLRWVAFTTGLPFIGFGFMDNAILIIAGDAIDTSLGVSLGITTLCAAAIGNIISDLAGIGCAAYIEEFCATTLKLPIPRLSSAQRQLRSVRMASQGGMAIGMTIGCILGMLPLLFIDANKADRLRERARLKRLYQDVLNEAKTLVEAESTCLYLRVDKDAAPKREGDGILPDYHPSVNGEYLYAMFYVEPTDQQRAAGGRNSTTTDTLMRMVSSGARINSSRNSTNNNNGDGGSDGASDGASASAVDASRDKRKIMIPPSVTHQKDSGGIGMVVAPPDGPKAPPEPHPTRVIPIGKGIVSRAVLTGTTWNIAGNLMDEPDFYPLSIEPTATAVGSDSNRPDRERFRDCVVVPILDGKGRVIAVLEVINKERRHQHSGDNNNNGSDDGGFTDQDVEILMSLASHVSVSLQKIYQDGGEKNEDDEFGLRDTIRILKEGKGIKRSITRRASNAGSGGGGSSSGSASCDGDDTDSTIAAANTYGPSTAGRKKVQLFPD